MTENPIHPNYSPPVDLLLVYGDPRKFQEWPDYLSLGFNEEHTSDLIRMSLDPDLNFADSDSIEVWAPIHAWRTLGQLRAQAAIEPLLALFHMFEEEDGSDWTSEDLPEVYTLIGAAAIPALAGYLLDESHPDFPREVAARSLRRIAEEHPDFRSECIAPIADALENFETSTPVFNALMISILIDMKAEAALPLIERAFAAENVELFGFADWDDVQVEFGLKEPDPNKERFVPPILSSIVKMFDLLSDDADDTEPPPFFDVTDNRTGYKPSRKADAKTKAKRKQAAKSRKINRMKRKK